MFPQLSIDDASNGRAGNGELLREVSDAIGADSAGISSRSISNYRSLDFFYLRISQFGRSMFGTVKRSVAMSPLLHFVGHIVGLRSKKQVLRVYAAFVVAMMENKKSLGYRPIVDFPRDAMGRCLRSACSAGHYSVSILRQFCGFPNPTAIWNYGNLSQKTINDRAYFSHTQIISCSLAPWRAF